MLYYCENGGGGMRSIPGVWSSMRNVWYLVCIVMSSPNIKIFCIFASFGSAYRYLEGPSHRNRFDRSATVEWALIKTWDAELIYLKIIFIGALEFLSNAQYKKCLQMLYYFTGWKMLSLGKFICPLSNKFFKLSKPIRIQFALSSYVFLVSYLKNILLSLVSTDGWSM
jgi:hypothetical protein